MNLPARDPGRDVFDMNGRVAWVTGAGKGLGRAIATALHAAGATVVATSRTDADLFSLGDELSVGSDTNRYTPLSGSVDREGFAKDAVQRIVTTHGQLDVLVNCAGISPHFSRSETLSDSDWQSVLSVNLNGAFFCAREAGAVMLPRGTGSIINVTSVHADVGFDRIAAYAASKGGLDALTRSLAVEWADRGVRVNSLAPGYFNTDLSSGLLANEKWGARIRAAIPGGRPGVPEELGGAVVFLASDASTYVTGTTVAVDGGWLAR